MNTTNKDKIAAFLTIEFFKPGNKGVELLEKLNEEHIAAETKIGVKDPKKINNNKIVLKVLTAEYEELTDLEKDLFYHFHKNRVFTETQVSKILPKNVETHTIVTSLGGVCIIRKPIGRVLGNVMSKIGAFSKDPDYYEAGSVIFRECKVFIEKEIETDPDQLFSVKMACLGATNMIESTIKKN